jgi:sulfate transport system permease protein
MQASTTARRAWRQPSALPGFAPAMDFTFGCLCLFVLIPLGAMVLTTFSQGWRSFAETLFQPRVLAAFRVTMLSALGAALLCAAFGLLLAWVLVQYRFPGRRLVDAAIDLPFALPTAVAGIALASLYAPSGWIGALLAPLGIQVAFTPLGILVALTFVGLPFVVRTVQPVLDDLEKEQEEAAAILGATRWQTFTRVILPAVIPAMLTGFSMALARGLGEYGSVIFIAGNKPMVSEIMPLLIVIQLEQYNTVGAATIGTLMLAAAFLLLLAINRLQRWSHRAHAQ